MGKLNFDLVKERALNDAYGVCSRWAPNGKKQSNEWVALNPTRSDSGARSFSINLTTGLWSEFATDDKGGDLISLVAYIDNVSQGEACKRLASYLGMNTENTTGNASPPPANKAPKKPAFEPIYPPPLNAAKSCLKKHFKLGVASQCWDYLSASGELLMRVSRFDRINSDSERIKEYRPCTYGKKNGRIGWQWLQLPSNRPLYGLETLPNFNASTPVIITEGEKAADAARLLFPDNACLTWSGGSKAIGKTNFAPLVNRVVWYWPDNDEAGLGSVDKLRATLNAAGASNFNVINIEVFNGVLPCSGGKTKVGKKAQWPEKADAADAVEFGWQSEHIATLRSTGKLLVIAPELAPTSNNSEVVKAVVANKLPYGFTLNNKGLYWKDLQSDESAPLRVSARIEVLAQSRSADGTGNDWGKLVQFCDADGEEKQWNIPMRLFATENGSEIMRGLLDRGFDVSAKRNTKSKLLEYLHGTQVQERAALVYKTGWYRDAFVMPDQTIGSDELQGERIHFHTEGGSMCKTATSGTLDEWRDNVGKYCVGNPLLMFAVSVAFSAPLVELLGMNTTVFHFYGSSGWGKSTGMNVACSIMGSHRDYQKTWKLTGFFLEQIAAAHSGLLLALDELGECEAHIVGDCVYMLGNGHGKGRGAKNGGVGKDQQWRMACLSNGENTLDATLAMAGKTKTAGMDVRFVEILASLHEDVKDQARYGSVNNIYDFEQPSEFADYLKEASTKYHGTAFPAFIEKLCETVKGKGRVKLTEWLRKGMADFKRKHLSQSASGQSIRVADAVALVAMVGELASKWGVTGWPKGEAYLSAEKCFKSWLDRRGGEGSLEDMRVLEHVRTQLATYTESRFKRWDAKSETDSAVIDGHQPITGEIWGYRREEKEVDSVDGDSTEVIFYILPDSFKRNFCNGMEVKKVARLLRDNGALVLTDGDLAASRLKARVRLPRYGNGGTYVYKIRLSALFGGGDVKEDVEF